MTRLGRYELVARLAGGGMAEIWLARRRGVGGFEKLVALKRVPRERAGEAALARHLIDEARLAAHLDHPNIARIYDLDAVDGASFIVMELVLGENLKLLQRRTWATRAAPLPPPLAARVVAEACRALHYAHTAVDITGASRAVIHRDVSPSNILVTYRGEVKVIDFGVARARAAAGVPGRLTVGTGGTAGYRSPEQYAVALGERADDGVGPRSDVFAAGVVLWELACGARLFGGLDDDAVRAAVCAPEPVRSLATAGVGLDPALVAVVDRALAKRPRERFASAAAMADALEAWIASQDEPSDAAALGALVEDLCGDRRARWAELVARARAADPD